MQGKWIDVFRSSRFFLPFKQHFLNEPEPAWRDAAGFPTELEFLRHELRTPLAGIIGMTELIQESCLSGEKDHYVAALQESARQMVNLINAGQPRAGLEVREPLAGKQAVNGRDFLERIILSHWPEAKKKDLRLYLYVHHELPSHWIIDPFALRQMLDNLLCNAIKFTHRGYVMLGARVARPNGLVSEDLELRVQDTGMGVPERDANRIYWVRGQGDGNPASAHDGSGFGLHICQRIIQELGGVIEHRATSAGGTCFRLVLPGVYETRQRENNRLYPALLSGIACRLALAEPAEGAVGEVLRSMGVQVKAVASGGLVELLGSCDALICDSSFLARNEAMQSELLSHSVPIDKSPLPQLISGNYSGAMQGKKALRDVSCVDLPQPILRSNLEPLLLRLALQKKFNSA